MSMAKTKKRVKNSKPRLKSKDSALEEHVAELIEKQNKTEIKQSIDAVVKKENKKAEVKEKKPKKAKTNDVYGKQSKDNYHSLQGAGVYEQIRFSPFVGFLYKSNIKANDEFYQHLEAAEFKAHRDELADHNLASSETMDQYAKKFTFNLLMGTDMNPISVEEKELMFFNLYDPTQRQIYIAKISLLGFNGDKIMHAPTD